MVYIDPSTSLVYSEHPPESVTLGENWSVAAINTILTSPVANSSAILFFYDENGGYWDPVVPPVTSTGQDGFRVPLLVLSPWTRAGTVCSQSLDPASVLHFIDLNWGLPFLSDRVATAPNLSCFFNYSIAPRTPLLLPTDVSLTG
ncbi:Phosphoesterase domain protein, partial [mine drainage metagenome]